MSQSGSFGDLRIRVISAIALLVLGGGAVWLGGAVFLALLALAGGLMIWELIRMMAPESSRAVQIGLGIAGAAVVLRAGLGFAGASALILVVPSLLGTAFVSKDKQVFGAYALAIVVAVVSLGVVRSDFGLLMTIWLILVVVASDVGGYFFGRILGGAKILPRISPKKTWSGTLGGWLLAAAVGWGFSTGGNVGGGLVWLSVLVAVAAQIGDVVESAIKRRTGVKDSSRLIPGHGGLLDRFDALIGAGLFVMVWQAVVGLPVGEAL